MKKLLWFGLPPIVFAAAVSTKPQNPPAPQTIVLYAPEYPGDMDRVSVDLQRAAYASRFNFGDVGYGLLRVGREVDWLEISVGSDRRSVFRDLGPHAWTDKLTVPWVEPLAKLKPGEVRQVFVSSNGAPGKGAPSGKSYEGLSALPGGGAGTNPDACCDTPISTGVIDRTTIREKSKRAPTPPAGVQTSPNMIRANLGHMYVVHVVDDKRDFYALFRIDALQPGNNCTISWKMIPPPPQPTTVKK